VTELTISASSYSLKTSNVDRRVPLRMVGSSVPEANIRQCHVKKMILVRGMIVNLLRRSVRPTLDMSTPSTSMVPLVGSTNLKNVRARVLKHCEIEV
jgi:hypothetical protein